MDNGYVTDAGVYRSFPTYDRRCSEDARITIWFKYADGEVLTERHTVPRNWDGGPGAVGFFTDSFGTPVPHPFEAAQFPDGTVECLFIYGDDPT